jgi:hypothetical protein
MKCPECGDKDAYMGFSSIDCPNMSCRHYQGNSTTTTATATAPAPAPAVASVAGPAGPQASQGSTGSATIVANPTLTVTMTAILPKTSSVEITFIASGDPGHPNKTVEFLWSLPNQAGQVICTLSSRSTYYVSGIDADGQTSYTTQWRCTLDGVQPTDSFTLDWRIF